MSCRRAHNSGPQKRTFETPMSLNGPRPSKVHTRHKKTAVAIVIIDFVIPVHFFKTFSVMFHRVLEWVVPIWSRNWKLITWFSAVIDLKIFMNEFFSTERSSRSSLCTFSGAFVRNSRERLCSSANSFSKKGTQCERWKHFAYAADGRDKIKDTTSWN